jgi:protein gp37
MGKLYRETKKEQGGTGANQFTTEQSSQNGNSAKTAEVIADQFGVGKNTVIRAEKFADAVDTIADTYGEEARGAILSGVAKMTQKEVVDTARTLPATAPKEHTTTPTFNQTNDNIEWARWSWNPVTGCLHDCQYCYARDIANRFYPEKFKPTFRPERLTAPQNTKVPAGAEHNIGLRNVFVCSMADLFGDWVPEEWILSVLDAARDAPQWNFLFLTKNPKRLPEFEWPENAWIGTTVDCQARVKPAEDAFARIDATVKFVSCEPLREPIEFERIGIFDWIIIGGQSRSSGASEMQPEWAWVERLLYQAREEQVAVYFKPNLAVRPREYPGGI